MTARVSPSSRPWSKTSAISATQYGSTRSCTAVKCGGTRSSSRFRLCDVFVFALAPRALDSAACALEYKYADALGKPILPVLIADAVSVNLLPGALARIQLVDYRRPNDKGSALRVGRALNGVPAPKPLPIPLPDPPAAPMSQLASLGARVAADTLSREEQALLVSELRRLTRDPQTSDDARALLRRVRQRDDLFARTAEEVAELLEVRRPVETPRLSDVTEIDGRAVSEEGTTERGDPGRRILVIGAVALVAIALIIALAFWPTPDSPLEVAGSANGSVSPQLVSRPEGDARTTEPKANPGVTVNEIPSVATPRERVGTPVATRPERVPATAERDVNTTPTVTTLPGSVTSARLPIASQPETQTTTAANATPTATSPVEATRKPVFLAWPRDQTVAVGASVTFDVIAFGRPAPTYRWQVSIDNGASWSALPDSGRVLTLSNVTAVQSGHRFRAVVENPLGVDTSQAATLTVTVPASPQPPAPRDLRIVR